MHTVPLKVRVDEPEDAQWSLYSVEVTRNGMVNNQCDSKDTEVNTRTSKVGLRAHPLRTTAQVKQRLK